MSDTVHQLRPGLVGDGVVIDPDQVLGEAIGKYRQIVVVGETEDGEIEVCGSHGVGDTLLLLAWAQNFIVVNRVAR